MAPSRPLPAALLSGALLAAASLPGPGGPLVLVALAPLFRSLLRGVGARAALAAGLLVGALHAVAGFGWALAAETGGGPPAPLVLLAVLPILAAGTGGWTLVVAGLARRSRALALAAAPGAWVALEYARAHELALGIPWNQLGYALGDAPLLAQPAAQGGVYGLSFWIVCVNVVLASGGAWSAAARSASAALLALPLLPALAAPAGAPPRETLRVAAVQPALGEGERRDPRRFAANLAALHAGSRRALAEPAQLVVWPESAYQRRVGGRADAFLAALAHDLGTPLVVGAWTREAGDRGPRNAALLALPDGSTPRIAEKQHPIPVYERAPSGALARWLARRGLWPGRFEPGAEHAPFLLARPGAGPVPVGVLVCIDASHPEVARRLRAAGARLLLAISNEAGSGPWSARLHARVTRLRAIELRVPIVRVASRGPSLWIDARGGIAAALAAGEASSAAHSLALAGPPSRFVRIGDARVAAAAALSAALAAGTAQRRSAFTPGRVRRAPASGSPPGPRGIPT